MGSALCGIKKSKKLIISSPYLIENDSIGPIIDTNKVGSFKIISNDFGEQTYIRRIKLYKSEKIKTIMKKLYLQDNHIDQLWDFFKQLDSAESGYINLEDLYLLIKESPNSSIVAPFLDRFFILIEKEYKDKICFEELIPNLVSYCLFSLYQIVEYVFNFIDKDHDGYISRNEIIRLLQINRDEEDLYSINHTWALEKYKDFKRSDKICKGEFIKACNKLYFIPYPAIYLQKCLKLFYIGNNFWKKLAEEVKHLYISGFKYNENIRIKLKIDKIKQRLQDQKLKIFEKIKADKLKSEKENYKKIYYEEIRLSRKLSDTIFYLVKFKENKSKLKNSKQREAESLINVSIHSQFSKFDDV
jgi:Ca2+-binding EF-hand superfamily protein